MSDTPRVDAVEQECLVPAGWGKFVPAEFARLLEREIHKLNYERATHDLRVLSAVEYTRSLLSK